jgi:DNA-binding MarR family transcriptional regulator
MDDDAGLAETTQCLCLASRKAARAITRAFDSELRGYGLRATQFSLLAALELKGAQSIGALAATLGADRTTMTRNLAPVEAQGLVHTRPGADPRVRMVEITAKGQRMLRRAFAGWRKVQAAMSETIGAGAAESLRRLARSTRG